MGNLVMEIIKTIYFYVMYFYFKIIEYVKVSMYRANSFKYFKLNRTRVNITSNLVLF